MNSTLATLLALLLESLLGGIGLTFMLSFDNALLVLLGLGGVATVIALRVAIVANRTRTDALTFDMARAVALTGLFWVATLLLTYAIPERTAALILDGTYTIAPATMHLFASMGLGGIAFLWFRLRFLRGRHEWQRE